MPITGTEPDHDHKIALPAGALGLVRRSWIVTSELIHTRAAGEGDREAVEGAAATTKDPWILGREATFPMPASGSRRRLIARVSSPYAPG
jgi:hypothetical protein